MRLGQLSRKLSVRTGDIVEFLSTNNIRIDNDSNTRLEDEHVALIVQHFAPELSEEQSVEAHREDSDSQEQNSQEIPPIFSAPAVELIESSKTEEETPDSVIKASKIELSGLKILGKIDLPERKKKETAADAEQPPQQDATTTDNQKRPDQRRSVRNDQGQKGRRKNPITAQREQEALEAEKKRQERAMQQKEQRTQNYLRRIKTAAPTKSARLIEEPMEELSKVEDTPTTLWGRFLRWLKK